MAVLDLELLGHFLAALFGGTPFAGVEGVAGQALPALRDAMLLAGLVLGGAALTDEIDQDGIDWWWVPSDIEDDEEYKREHHEVQDEGMDAQIFCIPCMPSKEEV